MEGVRYSIRFKLMDAAVFCAVAVTFLFLQKKLISLYIYASATDAERVATLGYAVSYLDIMLIGLIPFSLTQVYASAMRESGKTTLPMVAGMTAMVINFVFNALLIFGLLGFPKLGVMGAAAATVISRFTELAIVMTGALFVQANDLFFYGFSGFWRYTYKTYFLHVSIIKK